MLHYNEMYDMRPYRNVSTAGLLLVILGPLLIVVLVGLLIRDIVSHQEEPAGVRPIPVHNPICPHCSYRLTRGDWSVLHPDERFVCWAIFRCPNCTQSLCTKTVSIHGENRWPCWNIAHYRLPAYSERE